MELLPIPITKIKRGCTNRKRDLLGLCPRLKVVQHMIHLRLRDMVAEKLTNKAAVTKIFVEGIVQLLFEVLVAQNKLGELLLPEGDVFGLVSFEVFLKVSEDGLHYSRIVGNNDLLLHIKD